MVMLVAILPAWIQMQHTQALASVQKGWDSSTDPDGIRIAAAPFEFNQYGTAGLPEVEPYVYDWIDV
jgi:hypothetical protein